MTASTIIKTELHKRHIKFSTFAEQIGMTKQNFSNKLNRDNFTSKELFQIISNLNMIIIIENPNSDKYTMTY